MNMKESKAFGARITRIRTEENLNKQEFSRQLNISPAWVTYLESGEKAGEPLNPSNTMLFAIAHRFGVSFEWLKTGKGSMRPGLKPTIIARLDALSESQLKAVLKVIDALESGKAESPPAPNPKKLD